MRVQVLEIESAAVGRLPVGDTQLARRSEKVLFDEPDLPGLVTASSRVIRLWLRAPAIGRCHPQRERSPPGGAESRRIDADEPEYAQRPQGALALGDARRVIRLPRAQEQRAPDYRSARAHVQRVGEPRDQARPVVRAIEDVAVVDDDRVDRLLRRRTQEQRDEPDGRHGRTP